MAVIGTTFLAAVIDLNSQTGGLIGIGLHATVFFASFVLMKLYNSEDALLGALFLALMFTIPLWRVGLGGFNAVVFYVVAIMVVTFTSSMR